MVKNFCKSLASKSCCRCRTQPKSGSKAVELFITCAESLQCKADEKVQLILGTIRINFRLMQSQVHSTFIQTD